jgi:hypothetical protein
MKLVRALRGERTHMRPIVNCGWLGKLGRVVKPKPLARKEPGHISAM